MKLAEELCQQAGIKPKLKLVVQKPGGGTETTGPHTVQLINEKLVEEFDARLSKKRAMMVLTVEEDGEEKEYKFPVKNEAGKLHYLIEKLRDIPEGSEIIMVAKKAGGRTYIDVRTVKTTSETPADDIEDGEPDQEWQEPISTGKEPTQQQLDDTFGKDKS